MQPKVYLSCARHQPSAVTAMFYIEQEKDLFGWYMQAGEHAVSHAFFMLESFYSDSAPVLYRSLEDDVYELWTTDFPPARSAIRCPIPEELRHELERLQSLFVLEWLFFENDPDIGDERAAYQAQGLPLQAANIRARRLSRFEKDNDDWIHVTPGIDQNVVEFLTKSWRFGARSMRRAFKAAS